MLLTAAHYIVILEADWDTAVIPQFIGDKTGPYRKLPWCVLAPATDRVNIMNPKYFITLK